MGGILLREIDNAAIYAKDDAGLLNDFINTEKSFIYNCAFKVTGRYISDQNDESSIAMNAFVEAVNSYTFDKGSFISFAQQVIQRRIIDYIRHEKRHSAEISVNPYILSGEDNEEEDMSMIHQVKGKISTTSDDLLTLEIDALTQRLNQLGFSFFDLIEVSPKAEKTKESCKKCIEYIINSPILLNQINSTQQLPIKIIENNLGVPRKIIERHRKYIIAAVEIITGDYPHLVEYMPFTRKELCK